MLTDTETGLEVKPQLTTAKLNAALAKAQAVFPTIPLDREVQVTTKSGGQYKFKYATLGAILSATRKGLSENGLAVSQVMDGATLKTMLLHDSGEMLESSMPIRGNGTLQELGSELTYLRRYSVVALLGVVGEEDDDANSAEGNHAVDVQKPAAKPQVVPAQKPAPKANPAPKTDSKPKPTSKPAPAPVIVSTTLEATKTAIPPAQEAAESAGKPQESSKREDFGSPVAGEPLISQATKEKILAAFATFGITEKDLEAKSGCPVGYWTETMRQNCNLDYKVLKMGRCTKEQFLESEAVAVEFSK